MFDKKAYRTCLMELLVQIKANIHIQHFVFLRVFQFPLNKISGEANSDSFSSALPHNPTLWN